MSEKSEFTEEQKEECQRILDEIIKLSSEVVRDYKKNPSELSGSIIQVHEDSPLIATKEERLLNSLKDFKEELLANKKNDS